MVYIMHPWRVKLNKNVLQPMEGNNVKKIIFKSNTLSILSFLIRNVLLRNLYLVNEYNTKSRMTTVITFLSFVLSLNMQLHKRAYVLFDPSSLFVTKIELVF